MVPESFCSGNSTFVIFKLQLLVTVSYGQRKLRRHVGLCDYTSVCVVDKVMFLRVEWGQRLSNKETTQTTNQKKGRRRRLEQKTNQPKTLLQFLHLHAGGSSVRCRLLTD